MTNKLVVIINSLKYKLQLPPEPRLGGCRPQIPVLSVLCPQLNLLNPHRTKFLGTPQLHFLSWYNDKNGV
jgi:hypothetical protein